MDVGINKPFKSFIRGHFHDWLVTNRKTRPSRKDVVGWVSGAWKTISDLVVRIPFVGQVWLVLLIVVVRFNR
jgi:hypothetical protein